MRPGIKDVGRKHLDLFQLGDSPDHFAATAIVSHFSAGHAGQPKNGYRPPLPSINLHAVDTNHAKALRHHFRRPASTKRRLVRKLRVRTLCEQVRAWRKSSSPRGQLRPSGSRPMTTSPSIPTFPDAALDAERQAIFPSAIPIAEGTAASWAGISLHNNYFCVMRQQGATAGDNDGMVVHDQDARRFLCLEVLRGHLGCGGLDRYGCSYRRPSLPQSMQADQK